MADQEDALRDLGVLVVERVGALTQTGDPWVPFQLVDPSGVVVAPVTDFLNDLQAAGRAVTTQRSYGMALLRWFRPVDCTKSYW